MLLIKKNLNLKLVKVNFKMDINSQRETWTYFKKLTLYISGVIIFILILMAIFLL
jgi:hypothetical protein